MSWVKINAFHWHITDGTSFPLEVAQYSELAANGAYSADGTYSESDVQYVVQYAAAVSLSSHPTRRSSLVARYRCPPGACRGIEMESYL